MTAINVFDRLGIRPHLIYQEPRLAVDMLRKGEVDAIVAIEGKPLQWLNQINDRNLHLVPVDYAKPLQEEYLPSKLGSVDYPGLVAEGGFVETIAAEAVLASYNWAPNSDRYRRLSLLVDTMFDKVAQLQRPPFHPKWKEMAPRATVSGWTRFSRRRNGSTATCRCLRARPRHRAPRHRRRLFAGCGAGCSPCPAGSGSTVSRIPGVAGQPRQGQHQQVIGPAGNMVCMLTARFGGPSRFRDARAVAFAWNVASTPKALVRPTTGVP